MNKPVIEKRHRIPITFSVGVYNEERRIRDVLLHASCWADEIVVIDKSSTDRTPEICREFNNVKLFKVPYSAKGNEHVTDFLNFYSNKWVFFGTASEIPTRNLIVQARQILDETRGELDLIYVPRKIFSFGIYSPESPWPVIYYPFFVNTERAIISDKIHENFKAHSPTNTRAIPYAEDCCVYHFTHPTAKVYLNDMTQYFEAETFGNLDIEKKYRECFQYLDRFKKEYRDTNNELFGLYCAWQIYWLGTALFSWEKHRNVNVPEFYLKMRNQVLQHEWAPLLDSKNVSMCGASDPLNDNSCVITEEDLLFELSKRKICQEISVLYVVGAHRFQEKEIFFGMFQNLKKVYLFEPLPDYYEALRQKYLNDDSIEVFPYAVSDENIDAQFHVTDNDAASSSLLNMGTHLTLFPSVHAVKTISVRCRILQSVIDEYHLLLPDMLFLDVQGAEFKIVSSLSEQLRSGIKMIYTEASKEEVYSGARLLDDLKEVLRENYSLVGFAPLRRDILSHGNALFVNIKALDMFKKRNDTYLVQIISPEIPPSFIRRVARWTKRKIKGILRRCGYKF